MTEQHSKVYLFPESKFVTNSIYKQFYCMCSEVFEVFKALPKAIYTSDFDHVVVELFDVIHATETLIRVIFYRFGFKIVKSPYMFKMDVVKKNEVRGYYMSSQISDIENFVEHVVAVSKTTLQPTEFNKSGSKYLRTLVCTVDNKVDVYAVLEAFNVTCPAVQHATKKLLCAGIRGKGDTLQDLKEAKDAIERAIQLEMERV